MKKNLKHIVPFFIIIFTFSCIDSVDFENSTITNVLVVEGGVSTLEGPHYVKLSRTARYGDIFGGVNASEPNAEIYLRDDLGNVTVYKEVGSGVYKSPDSFKGIVGRSYSLFIQTKDGNEYLSEPEKIYPVSPIDSVFYEFKSIAGATGQTKVRSGVDVKVIVKDPLLEKNYYKWTTKGTFKFKANPELYTPPRATSPKPKDCCEICWLSEENVNMNVKDDKLFEGNEFIHTAYFLEDERGRFYEKYFIEIEQKSISESAFTFYSLLQGQLEINGDIFDTPPTEITGNIISLSNPDEVVIGYFVASDISRKSLYIYGDDLPVKQPLPIIKDDCRTVVNATSQQPLAWE